MREQRGTLEKLVEACAEIAGRFDIPLEVVLKDVCMSLSCLVAERERKRMRKRK